MPWLLARWILHRNTLTSPGASIICNHAAVCVSMCRQRSTDPGGQPAGDDFDDFDDEETFLNLDDVLHGALMPEDHAALLSLCQSYTKAPSSVAQAHGSSAPRLSACRSMLLL